MKMSFPQSLHAPLTGPFHFFLGSVPFYIFQESAGIGGRVAFPSSSDIFSYFSHPPPSIPPGVPASPFFFPHVEIVNTS